MQKSSNITVRPFVRLLQTWFCFVVLVGCVALDDKQPQRSMSTDVVYAGESWSVADVRFAASDAVSRQKMYSLIEHHLHSRGVQLEQSLSNYRQVSLEDAKQDKSQRYIVTANIMQWRAANADNTRPFVDMEMSIYDRQNQANVWTQSASERGSRHGSLSSTANRVVAMLVNEMNIVLGQDPSGDSMKFAAAGLARHTEMGSVSPQVSTALRRSNTHVSGQSVIKSNAMGKSVAIFYAANPPVHILGQFDRVILEPDNINLQQLADINEGGAMSYAYLSVGEVGPSRAYAREIKPQWVLGENTTWNSKVLDLSNAEVRSFLLSRVQLLVNKGFAGLFLDTMDSYQLFSTNDTQRKAQEQGLGLLIKQMHQQHKGIRLIANRGFELLPQISAYLEAVAAESLYKSWHNETQRYVDVSAQDRAWLQAQLTTVKNQFQLDAIAIDYLPPEKRGLAREVALDIAKLGFTPWVSTPGFDYIGVGAQEVLPRKVLTLFDSREQGAVQHSSAHNYVAMPLEYFGYVPDYLDIATQELPAHTVKGRYAGIVSWSSKAFAKPGYAQWLKNQMRAGVPIAVFNSMGFELDEELKALTGLTSNKSIHADSVKVLSQSTMMGYERPFPQRVDSIAYSGQSVGEANTVHMSVVDKNNNQADLVVTGPWGGMSLYPSNVITDVDGVTHWNTNPFQFLKTALKLEMLPMPDVTTENGKRLWMAHIDGDALPSWAELPGRRLGAELIQSDILNRYRMPHSISIVEAEMTSIDAYADRRNRMFKVARSIFKDPLVELATHTFSHPYHWSKVIGHPRSGKYNLPVKGYVYDPEREIAGSIKFIDENLAPAGKSTEIVLWSGNALPQESALAEVAKLGLPNLNGAFTVITTDRNTMSLISPMFVPVGPYIQAYAPIMNENVYTDNWKGPFDGFRRVIETLELTDQPRRIKPLSIYYHFYAGTKTASLKSLEEIYDWSIRQDVMPVYASYYAKKVPAFTKAGVSRYLDGTWKLSSLGDIRSIRWLGIEPNIDIERSQGLVGTKKLHDGVYLHTDGANTVTFKQGDASNQTPYISSANGVVTQWSKENGVIMFRVQGHVPVKLELGGQGVSLCNVTVNGKRYNGRKTKQGTFKFSFLSKDTGHAILNCQA